MDEYLRVQAGLFYSACALAAAAVGTAGCRNEKLAPVAPAEQVMLQGTNTWLPLSQLRQLSDDLVRKQGARLSEDRFEVTASVYGDPRSNLVTFQYFRGFGLPVYYVTFDRSGGVATSTNRTAAEYHP